MANALSERLIPTDPHRRVDWEESAPYLFQGIDGRDRWEGRAYHHASRIRELQEDPVTRLFLRGRLAERCGHEIRQRTGMKAALDGKERKTLISGKQSAWHSARTLRVAMTLHAALVHEACSP